MTGQKEGTVTIKRWRSFKQLSAETATEALKKTRNRFIYPFTANVKQKNLRWPKKYFPASLQCECIKFLSQQRSSFFESNPLHQPSFLRYKQNQVQFYFPDKKFS